MKKLSSLTIAISLLMGSQSAGALTPWVNGAPNLTIYLSGAISLNNAYNAVVTNTLAAPNSVDIFNDVDPNTGTKGSRWTAHYFTGNDALGLGLAGKKILLVRRTVGGSGYGVIPLTNNIPVEHLRIAGLPEASWVADGVRAWKQTLDTNNATTYLIKKVSDGGSIAVDPSSILKPGTQNYPEQINELATGLPEPGWPLTLTKLPAGFTVLPTGGLVSGIGVTLDLYKVLQAAQIRAGSLPATVAVGNYSEPSLPNLNRNIVASLLAGKIGAWDQIKIVDKTDANTVKSLLHSDILTDAGVAAPYKEATTGNNLTPVAVGLRNNGASTSVVAYSVFLNYPGTLNAFSPASATPDNAIVEDASLPIVKKPIIIADTGTLLKDWQNGTNVLGFNNVVDGLGFAKRWGIALNSADRNTTITVAGTGGDPWRYIKIDGYAPTLENVAAGVYPYWGEGVVLYRTTKASDPNWALKTKILKTLADEMGSPAVIGAAVTTQAWGKTGAFATTTDPRRFAATVPLDPSNPVSPFSHKSFGTVHAEIVPVADRNAAGGLEIQMK